jgi:hypothetical protein
VAERAIQSEHGMLPSSPMQTGAPRRLPSGITLTAAVALGAWVAFVLASYFPEHEGVLVAARIVGTAPVQLLSALCIFTAAASAGERILAATAPVADARHRLLLSIALGAGALSIAIYVAGFFGLANFLVAFALVMSAILWGLRPLLRDAVEVGKALRPSSPLATVLVVVLGVLLLGSALAPPNDWDELSYHLPLAITTAGTGRFPLAAHDCSAFPQLCESLTAIGLMLGATPGVGRVIHFGFGVLLAFAVYLASQALSPDRKGAPWMSVAILVLEPVFVDIARVAGVDLTLCFFAIVGVTQILRATTWRDVFVAGILGGYGLGTTYRAVHVAIALAAAVIASGRLRTLWALALGGAVAACPFYLRNLALAGNPVYPMMSSVFHSTRAVPTGFTALGWPDPSVHLRQFDPGMYGIAIPFTRWLRLPWDATIVGHRFTGGLFDTDISPFYLATLPVFLLVEPKKVRRETWTWIAFAGIHSISWALGLWCTRYELGALAAFAVLFPAVVEAVRWSEAARGIRFVSWALCAVLYVSVFGKVVSRNDLKVLFGLESAEHYLATREDGPLFQNTFAINGAPETRGPVLMFGEKRTMYFTRPVIPDFNLDNVGALYRNGGGTAQGMRDLLVRSGISYIVEHTIESHRWLTPEEAKAYDEFCKEHTRVVQGEGGYLLWRVVR